jgi:hypothetical protein
MSRIGVGVFITSVQCTVDWSQILNIPSILSSELLALHLTYAWHYSHLYLLFLIITIFFLCSVYLHYTSLPIATPTIYKDASAKVITEAWKLHLLDQLLNVVLVKALSILLVACNLEGESWGEGVPLLLLLV